MKIPQLAILTQIVLVSLTASRRSPARRRAILTQIVLVSLTTYAQPIQPEVLVSFNGTNGANPRATLSQGSDGTLYGTTYLGGLHDKGTVFRVTTNGTLTQLFSFAGDNGAFPSSALVPGQDGHFYGTTEQNSSSGSDHATVFRITTNGAFATLVSFASANEGRLKVNLTLGNNGDFFGTTSGQGGDYGTLFRMTTNGALTTLASFNATNGSYPSTLTLGGDGNFYGTTYTGGSNALGTVFRLTTNGVLTTLVSFGGDGGHYPQGLTLGSDGNLYGTTFASSVAGVWGTVFRMTLEGVLTTLASFNGTNAQQPQGGLALGNDGNFYGISENSVYQATTQGTLAILLLFNDTPWWVTAQPTFVLGSDGNYYGTTANGGANPGPNGEGYGRVFRVRPAEPVFISQPQPDSQVVPAGVNVRIDTSVFGAPPLAYRWTHNGPTLPTATNASLILSNVNPLMSGLYALRASNHFSSFTWSSNAVLTVLPAVVTTLPAGGITATSAVLNGSVTLGPVETRAWFEWGTDTSYGQVIGVTNLAALNGTVTFGNSLGGLTGSQLYHYRAVASNSFGVAFGSNQTFQVGQRPIAVTLGANGITTNGATLNAAASPEGRPTTAWFRWGTNASLSNLTPATNIGSGTATVNFSDVITGLPSNALHYYRVVASNSLGVVNGGVATFTIAAPQAFTAPATAVTGTNAWINGEVTPNTLPTTAWFEWGTNTSYGNTVWLGEVGNGNTEASVNSFLSNLDPAVTYHFRLVASNALGLAVGAALQISTALDAYGQQVIADQPLVYYRFEETNGAVALNAGILGALADGTYNPTVVLGSPSMVPAFGYAAEFNNTNSSIAVPALGTNNRVTLEVWAKPRSFATTSPGNPSHTAYNSIYTVDSYASGALHTHFVNSFPNQYWQVAINPSHTDIEFRPGDFRLFPSNSWVHLAATHDSASAAHRTIAYINGRAVLTNNNSTTVPVNLAAAHIGAWVGYENWFDGWLDEFAIYTNVLSASRIQAHYQAAIGNPILLSTQTTNRLTFSWAGPGFRLQSNTNLANVAGWTNVPAGSNSPVSVTISNSGNRFFRLKWP